MKSYRVVQADIATQRERIRGALEAQNLGDVPVTVICVPRHGHATAKVNVESLYASTSTKFVMLYVDVASPACVSQYLEEQARIRQNFFHVRIEANVSRQIARLAVLDLVTTEYTLFTDNNMLYTPGWLETLLRTTGEERAAVASPFIVMQGGNIHFSASTVTTNPDGTVMRRQDTPDLAQGSSLANAEPRMMDIDFAESHTCMIATEAFKGRIATLFPEAMHNSHTLAYATYLLKTEFGCRMIVDPDSLTSILPIGFGYDLPWIFEVYNDLACFKQSYGRYSGRIAEFPLVLDWHRKHLLYVLLSMVEHDTLRRQDLLETREVPPYLYGYDWPLPADTVDRIERDVVPFVEERYPELLDDLRLWLDDKMDAALGSVPERSSHALGERDRRIAI